MSNSINKVSANISKPSINKVNGKSANEYSQESAALQEDINEMYNQMLLNDYDKAAYEADMQENLDEFDNFVDTRQEVNNGEVLQTAATALPKGIDAAQSELDAWYEMMVAPGGPVDASDSNEFWAAVETTYAMMSAGLAMAEQMAPVALEAAEKAQEKRDMRIDNFQTYLDNQAEEKAQAYEDDTKEMLKAETEANGGQVVSATGAQITIDGSTNQDLYIEGSGNTIVIDDSYSGQIVFAPDATDNTVIIEGDYEEGGSLSMGGKNNNINVSGDIDAELVIGGDGNTVTAGDDVNSDVNFGGEGNTVIYGDEFTGNIPQNSSTFNTVKSVEEIEAENAELQGQINNLQNQQTNANANAAAAGQQNSIPGSNPVNNGSPANTEPAFDANGIPLPGSPVANA